MPLISVLEVVGLDADASDSDIAARMRELAGLEGQSTLPQLWVCVLDNLSMRLALPKRDQISDMGELAWVTAEGAVIDGDARYTEANWRRELAPIVVRPGPVGVLSFLAGFVARTLGPLFAEAGLSRAQPTRWVE